ncbi:MAG: ornithine carbamoyltransferase [Rhodothalassiaceae bacterium]
MRGQAAAAPLRHFTDVSALPVEDLQRILSEAARRKQARGGLARGQRDADRPLDGHVLATLFAHPSTRTRVSMDMAMHQLGGRALELPAANLQTGRGESLADTARVLSTYVDAISFRARRHADLLELTEAAQVPVINALTDRSHPCQSLADVLTLAECFGDVSQLTVAWIGDGNNVLLSLLEAAAAFGFAVRLCCPAGRQVNEARLGALRDRGARLEIVDEPAQAARGVQAIYTDTWVSMGDALDDREAVFGPYRVDAAVMAAAAPEAVFLHCLPAHRGEEVSAEVLDGPQAAVWQQAENRLHAQKAIILYCLGWL